MLGGCREEVRAIARGVVASLAVSPLADRVHVVAAGIDCYGFANERRVHAVAGGAEGVELATSLARPRQARPGAAPSRLDVRLAGRPPRRALGAGRARHPRRGRVGRDATAGSALTELGGRGLALLTDERAAGAVAARSRRPVVASRAAWARRSSHRVWPLTSSPTSAPCSSTRQPSRWRSARGRRAAGHRRGLRGARMGLAGAGARTGRRDRRLRARRAVRAVQGPRAGRVVGRAPPPPDPIERSSRALGDRRSRCHLRQRRVRRPPGDGPAGRTPARRGVDRADLRRGSPAPSVGHDRRRAARAPASITLGASRTSQAVDTLRDGLAPGPRACRSPGRASSGPTARRCRRTTPSWW